MVARGLLKEDGFLFFADMYIISCENYEDHGIENDHRNLGISVSSGGQ